ncbi:MAG: carboxypeptidase-like regulatory domain-containing protein [Phycisphaerae bacterium]|jgi:hypothetical protein
MRRVTLWSIVLSCTAIIAVGVAPAQTLESEATTLTLVDVDSPPPPPPPPPPPIVTIAKGEHSHWGAEQPDFAGVDLLIRDPNGWVSFWRMHTGEPVPPPPVDFARQVVVAVVQGWQPTGCGPNIAIVDVQPAEAFVEITIVDDERPGDCDVVTNPFHVVAVSRELLRPRAAIAFKHMRPMPETGVVSGRVFAAPPEHEPMPLHGAHLVLRSVDGEPREAMSGQDGSYFFVNVPPGEYLVIAEHPDFEPVEAPAIVPPNARIVRDFFLLPQPPAGAFMGHVLGVLGEGQIVPVAQALVRLLGPDGEIAHARTNRLGCFAMPHIPPGAYHAIAEAAGWLPDEADVEIQPGTPTEHVFHLQRP